MFILTLCELNFGWLRLTTCIKRICYVILSFMAGSPANPCCSG